MAKYSDIKGFTVQTVSSDPAASIAATGSFSSGGTLNTPRTELAGTVGIQTAAMATGRSGPAPAAINEQYDGSSWTEVGDLNTGRGRAAGAGTSYTASIVFGGVNNPGDTTQSITESWNGSAWTEVNDLPAATSDMSGLGTQTSAFCVGGNRTAHSNLVYSWDGTSWTSGTAINTGRQYLAASGTTPAALVFGGRTYPGGAGNYGNTELWNGSSWTEVNDLNTARFQLGGFGTSTSALAMGGGTPSATAKAESWDGTNWTEVSDLASANSMQSAAAGADATVGLAVAGTVTEEWTTTPSALFQQSAEGQLFFNSTANAFKETITDLAGGAWAAGGNLNVPRSMMASASAAPQGAAMAFGGFQTSPSSTSLADTEEYNGTAWTEVNNINTARRLAVGTGSQPAALMATGQVSPGPGLVTNVELWDGTNWTETTDVNTARRNLAAFGTQTLGLIVGGLTPSITGNTELWNGSSWTETTDLNTGRESYAGFGGSYTSGLVSGGYVSSPNPNSAITETWDGSTWTEVGDLNTGRKQHAASGQSVNSGMINTGYTTTGIANCESWNGTSWTERADVSTARWELGGMGTTAAGLICGGATPSITAATEEFTAPLANKTIGSS